MAPWGAGLAYAPLGSDLCLGSENHGDLHGFYTEKGKFKGEHDDQLEDFFRLRRN